MDAFLTRFLRRRGVGPLTSREVARQWASMPIYDGLYVRDYRTDSEDLASDSATFCQ